MFSPRIAAVLVVAPLVLAPAADSQNAVHRAGTALAIEPVELELGGLGRGTLVLPSVHEGLLHAQLVDTRTEAVLVIDALVTPHFFYAPHAPAGAILGGLYEPAAPESEEEPRLIAAIDGEWATNSDGEGVLLLRIVQRSNGGAAVVGLVEGTFRVPPYDPAVLPLAGPGSTGLVVIQPSETPTTIVRRRDGGALSAEARAEGPIIIVDSVPPPIVSRVRLVWWMAS